MKRWQQKEYECLRCGKTYKNGYKFLHNKMCKIDDHSVILYETVYHFLLISMYVICVIL